MAEKINLAKLNPGRILDIGSGTGLLSLILAQETSGTIDAIEIVAEAAEQSNENFEGSPWKDRLHCFQTDVNDYKPVQPYDFIISNPPFFEGDLKSGNQAKNAAKHDTGLTLDVLVINIYKLLSENGTAAVLIPYQRTRETEKLLALHSMFVVEKMQVRQSVNHDYFRTMFIFGKNETVPRVDEMAIHDAKRAYTREFKRLLSDFYLFL